MRFGLRSLFVFVTALTLGLALVLCVGRVLTWQLDDDRANRWINPQGLAVEGINARWRLLNPVLDIQVLRLGDSRLQDVVVELDWVESLLRQALVLRHLSVGDGELVVAFTDLRGWHLSGMPATEQQLSWFDTVYESDELQYSGLLSFVRGDDAEGFRVAAALVNRGGSHRADVTLTDPNCVDECGLHLQFDDREALWPLWYRELAASAQTYGRGIAIPSPLLMGTQARLADFQLRWDRTATRLGSGIAADAGIGAGLNFVVRLDDVLVPGGRPFSVHLAADGTSIGGVATARVHAGRLQLPGTLVTAIETADPIDSEASDPEASNPQAGDPEAVADGQALELPPMWLQWTPTALRAFVPKLSLDSFFQFVADTRELDDVAGQWLQALSIKGQLSDLRLQRKHEGGKLGYQADFAEISMQGFRGVPLMRQGAGRLAGYATGVKFDVAAPQMTLGFPDIFLEPWELRDFSGSLTLVRADSALRLVGRDVRGNFENYDAVVPNRMLMGFDLHLPPERESQILSLGIRLNQAGLPKAKTFLPTKLGAGVRQWIMRGPQDGALADVDFAYIGHTRGDQGPQSRRAAMSAQVSDAVVVYHEAWPLVRDIAGQLTLSGPRAVMQVEQARTQNLQIGASEITVSALAGQAVVQLEANFDLADGLNFVRQTPLRDSVTFVRDEWAGEGPVSARGSLVVPIDGATTGVVADLDFSVQGASLNLPELRMPLTNVKGTVSFESPNRIQANALSGRLFGSAWRTKINTEAGSKSTQDPAVVFAIEGRMLPTDVYQLLDLQDPGIAEGASEYQAIMRFPTNGDTPSLQLTGDLIGTELVLPGQLAKAADQARGLSLQAQFAPKTTDIRLRYPGLVGALQIAEGSVKRGALQLSELSAVATPVPQFDMQSNHVSLGGTLAELDVGAFGDSDAGLFGEVPFEIDELQIQQLRLDTAELGLTTVSGSLHGASYHFQLLGERIAGVVKTEQGAPLHLRLEHLRLSADETDPELVSSDPVETALIARLPAMDVVIQELHFGEEAFGQWQFMSEVEGNNLIFEELSAEVKGLKIKADTLMWHGNSNQTHFSGSLDGTNLAEVLPQWGYEPTLTTKEVVIGAVVSWAGSPVYFDLERVRGELFFSADEGRFLDVETASGALRIFSLLNFSAIAKRINFDFSDVVGKGVSFDDLGARVSLVDGLLTFVEPMEVEGTGSSFLLAGRVNLASGELDNEMIVTLPVSKGLPWYAAYVAIANPLAGLGVLVGERVLRKPLEQFSSAKYRISGTLDDPQVKFVSVFDRSMDMDLKPDTPSEETPDVIKVVTDDEVPVEPVDPNPNPNPKQENGTL